MAINLNTFSKLRLSKYLPSEEFEEVSSFEFMDEVWVGEIAGFTQILQLESDPEVTRSVQIDLRNDPNLGQSILVDLEMFYRLGMSRIEIEKNTKVKPFR